MKTLEDLEKLQKLKENGTLTEEEFELAKSKIINTFKEESNEQIVEPEVKKNESMENRKSGYAITGFVLGLCAIIAWLIPLFGYPVAIVGLVFSVKGMKSINKNLATVGLILCIIFLTLTCINSCAGFMISISKYYY